MAFISTGIVIAFATGFLAEMLDITPPGSTRESVNVSHQGTIDDHNFIPVKLTDNGELAMDVQYDPAVAPPIHEDPEVITMTYANSGASVWTFTGFMTGFEPSAPFEDKLTAAITIKVDGAIAIT